MTTKRFAPGVDLRCSWSDEYTGTADALVAAGIVPAGCFPGWPGMAKAVVNLRPDGTVERVIEPGGRRVTRKSKGQRTTYMVEVSLPWEVKEPRRLAEDRHRAEWERRMDALPRPTPLIDLPGFRSAPKAKPEFRVDGNVIHLAPRTTWRAEA